MNPEQALSEVNRAIELQGNGELSQAESALHFLAPSLLDCAANGNVIGRTVG